MWYRHFMIFMVCMTSIIIRQSMITNIPGGENLIYGLLKGLSIGPGSLPVPLGLTTAVLLCYVISGILTGFMEKDKDSRSLAFYVIVIFIFVMSGLAGDRYFAQQKWGTESSQILAISYQKGHDYATAMQVEMGSDSYIKLKKAGINTEFNSDNCDQLKKNNACKAFVAGFVAGSKKEKITGKINEKN